MESMAREPGVDLDVMELQVDANAAIGIIERPGLGKVKHFDFELPMDSGDCPGQASRLAQSTVRRQYGRR